MSLTASDELEFSQGLPANKVEVEEASRASEESHLREVKEKYERTISLLNATLESTADGILVADGSGKITKFNQKFAEIWQIPESVLATRDDEKMLSFVLDQLADPVGFLSEVQELYLKIDAPSFDVVKFKDGKTIERYSQPQKLDGTTIGRVWSFRDVTERKQAEMERQVLSDIAHGFVTTNDLGEMLKLVHQSLKKLLYAENCFFALYEQNTGLFHFTYFIDQYDSAPAPTAMPTSCSAYVYRTGKSLLMTPGIFKQLSDQNQVELIGSPSPSWIGVPLKTAERVIGILVLQNYENENCYNENHLHFLDSIGNQVANVIERKRAEEGLRVSEARLRELNATKDKFFSIIAHDLKNPFNNILGLSQILKDQSGKLDKGTMEKYVDTINSSALMTYELLENLLKWAISQQGNNAFDPKLIDLTHLVQSILLHFKVDADKKNLDLSATIDEGLMIMADENMISTCLRNLISNAIKFTPRNGTIKVNADVRDGQARISVSDTGMGMTDEETGKLFKIETNYTRLGTDKEKGTGLGLILCKEFVEKLGGQIGVESQPGKGSTFNISIPV